MAEIIQIDEKSDAYKADLSIGNWILVMLGVLTVGEFLVGVIAPPWGVILLIIALWKAFYVVKDFMHVGRLFGNDEETH